MSQLDDAIERLLFRFARRASGRTPVAPIGMGRASRGVELESLDAIDERQAASWMQQAATLPGFGGKQR